MIPKTSIPPSKEHRQNESGNVFLFILIGVVLFAALSFTMSRGFRSEGTSKLTDRQAELAANEILDFAQRLQRTVNKLRRNGCSENEISFENSISSAHTFVTRDECKVFNTAGGNLNIFPDADYLNTSQVFSSYRRFRAGGTFYVDNVGENTRAELIFYIGMANPELCKAINKKLGTLNASGNSPSKPNSHVHAPFLGVFNDPPLSWQRNGSGAADINGLKTGCFTYYDRDPETELFFYTLLER